MTLIKNHSKDILIFLFLAAIIFYLQSILLEPHLNYGFTPDDWWPLAHFNYLKETGVIQKLLSVWRSDGVYTTYQVLYISLLHHLYGFDYEKYQLTNHILKILSSIAIYPLVAIVFKNRTLGFITSILYAISYAPVGTLEIVAKGSDFLSIIIMTLFFIVYFYNLKGSFIGWKSSLTLSLLLVLTMATSPIRMYPVLLFIALLEIYFLQRLRKKEELMIAVKRIAFLFLPFVFILLFSTNSISRFLFINAPDIANRILLGNWTLIFHPLGSFGSLFLLNDYWSIFGQMQLDSLGSFISYILFLPLIIFSTITIFYSILLSIPLKKFLRFFFKILTLNIFLEIMIYFIFKNSQLVPEKLKVRYSPDELYPVFFALYILILVIVIFKKWNVDKDNNLLFALWIGPFFSLIFIILTWVLADYIVIFKGVHSYLTVPSLGASIFIGSTLVLMYEKIKKIPLLGKSLAPLVFFLLIPIFNINQKVINYSFFLSSYSMNAVEQEAFRDRLWYSLKGFDNSRPALFFFATLNDKPNGRFYEQTMLGRFSEWMYFQAQYSPNKCLLPVFIIDKLDLLKKSYAIQNGKFGFSYINYCGDLNFYQIKDFYAFDLINKQPVNIKEKILKEIEESLP